MLLSKQIYGSPYLAVLQHGNMVSQPPRKCTRHIFLSMLGFQSSDRAHGTVARCANDTAGKGESSEARLTAPSRWCIQAAGRVGCKRCSKKGRRRCG